MTFNKAESEVLHLNRDHLCSSYMQNRLLPFLILAPLPLSCCRGSRLSRLSLASPLSVQWLLPLWFVWDWAQLLLAAQAPLGGAVRPNTGPIWPSMVGRGLNQGLIKAYWRPVFRLRWQRLGWGCFPMYICFYLGTFCTSLTFVNSISIEALILCECVYFIPLG